MKIAYTPYALTTLAERKINKKSIEEALLFPDEPINGKKGRKIAHKREYPKLLRVIYEEEENVYIVITAYYTEPKRYMNHERQL
ncbi:DUF4258 domain-containing protein [Candidatus Woesearchaeota archaeon]|nr:DUF4258 domain-containing protein [Candidatus Woesearchaeota archaeon]